MEALNKLTWGRLPNFRVGDGVGAKELEGFEEVSDVRLVGYDVGCFAIVGDVVGKTGFKLEKIVDTSIEAKERFGI